MERLLLTLVVGGLTTLVLLLLDRRSRRRAARALVAEPAGAPALVVFRSATCGRCDAQMRQIAALDDVAVRVVDVEWAPETARRFGVMSLPSTVVSSPAGRVVAVNHGFASTAQLDTARDTDPDRPRPGRGPRSRGLESGPCRASPT